MMPRGFPHPPEDPGGGTNSKAEVTWQKESARHDFTTIAGGIKKDGSHPCTCT